MKWVRILVSLILLSNKIVFSKLDLVKIVNGCFKVVVEDKWWESICDCEILEVLIGINDYNGRD